ncbi:MAG: hypothetical protein LBL48_07720 [Azoarcus sp.]|jgi:predicted hotdog family 3-hydroxylacyl-ACP dehydratase|nr:hypothetical protein [Azoarcus sp.]
MNRQAHDMHDYLPIAKYLPHRGYALLLDHVVEASAKHILCSVTLRESSPFCREGRVPAYVGIEYMAQAAGALIGWDAYTEDGSPGIGFLVSVRKFTSTVDGFAAGTTLMVEAREVIRDNDSGLGTMACAIYHPVDVLIAKTQLTAYMPKDLKAFSTVLK